MLFCRFTAFDWLSRAIFSAFSAYSAPLAHRRREEEKRRQIQNTTYYLVSRNLSKQEWKIYKMSKMTAELGDLPDEILGQIFVRISSQSWLAFGWPRIDKSPSLTCHRWRNILCSKSFWRQYHTFWNANVPPNLYKKDRTWQYFASLR